MTQGSQKGAGSVGGIIGIIIVVLILLFGAYYFWQYKLAPRLNQRNSESSATTTYTNFQPNEVNIQVSATSS
ncbi:MAG TPA: hypothetical protein VFA52_03625 [Candidatus Paceibacterota bacterium]|nr:hypothetical protein [Candidatus Paceibacterota bacterium]